MINASWWKLESFNINGLSYGKRYYIMTNYNVGKNCHIVNSADSNSMQLKVKHIDLSCMRAS